MSTIPYVFSTIVAGSAFGLALLWVLAEWLKADDQSEECEKDMRQAAEQRKAAEAAAAARPPGEALAR